MIDGRSESVVGNIDVFLLVFVGQSGVKEHSIVGHADEGVLVERVR